MSRAGADPSPAATPADRRSRKEAIADLIVIGCSAGGPQALQTVLPLLPPSTRTSVVVAQHMPGRFTSLFALRLARVCALPVREPADGEPLGPGHIYIAPGGRQTRLEKVSGVVRFGVRPRHAGERYAPSADVLMGSVADLFGSRVLAVLMSGMGSDGVAGLRAIKARRGRTIAESEETAAVFGMPREAIRAGLADQVLPLREIALTMASLCRP
jgi:two-component system, chemotaxis family, protein-glutamate methylesterase/glutaminase